MKGRAAPCGLWEHAIVTKTFLGIDKLVRKCELRLSGQRTLIRPIHKLYLIATAKELTVIFRPTVLLLRVMMYGLFDVPIVFRLHLSPLVPAFNRNRFCYRCSFLSALEGE